MRLLLAFLVVSTGALSSGSALAHIQLDFPLARWEDQKAGPCGRAQGARTDRVSRFKPGATVLVRWRETIDHPGHYRIAFDEDGDDSFPIPAGYDDTSGGPTVLVDGIPDRSGAGEYTQEITLPNVTCDNCTLQLIQMMTDKAPYGDGNDIYFQCADLELSEDAPDGGGVPLPETEPSGCRCVKPASSMGGPVSVALLLVALALARRRDRR